MQSADELRRRVVRIDGRGYKAYSDLRGAYALGSGTSLHVDHVQGDPFAAPSQLRLRVAMEVATVPPALRAPGIRRIALADFLAREVRDAIAELGRGRDGPPKGGDEGPDDGGRRREGRVRNGSRSGGRGRSEGSGTSGLIEIDAGGQEVLERTAVRIHDEWVEARIEVGLPAAGRRVLGQQAAGLLLDALPRIAERALRWTGIDAAAAERHVLCVENQEHIRSLLPELGLVAFVGDGAILPRESGASEKPMPAEHTRPFHAPESLRVELPLANAVDGSDGRTNSITGMGIPRGITLIVGGGYHGKSTLLRALECCVYPHVPGDGREYVVSDGDLVKIRAEDGRAVTGVDIHGFIDGIPAIPGSGAADDSRRTRHFSTSDASGSTSQAAGIVEAIEAGATGLLLDEDTSASNFMLRDARMQQLVHKANEPITPFIDRVRELHEAQGISTVLVMGGSGDYFDVADTVVMMRDYAPEDVTAAAREVARRAPSGRAAERPAALEPATARIPLASSFDPSRGRHDVKISTKNREHILYGRQSVDLRAITQLLDTSQTRAVAVAIHLASTRFMATGAAASATRKGAPLGEVLDRVEALIDEGGLERLDPYSRGADDERHPGRLARPRRHEIAAAINRMRDLRVDAPTVRRVGP